jgi:hypothetical protein
MLVDQAFKRGWIDRRDQEQVKPITMRRPCGKPLRCQCWSDACRAPITEETIIW